MAFVSPPTYQLTYGDFNNQYSGPVTVTLDQYVLNACVKWPSVCDMGLHGTPLRSEARCSLPLATPCQYQGQLYTNAAQVDNFKFNVAPFGPGAPTTTFYNYISNPNDLYRLNTVSWLNVNNSSTCASQLDNAIPEDFYALGWFNYIAGASNGFQQVCNTTTGVPASTLTTPAVSANSG